MASKFMDKVKYFMGFPEYEEDDERVEETTDDKDSNIEQSSSKVVSFRSATTPSSSISSVSSVAMSSMKVFLYQPAEFDDARTVVDNLKAQKPVVLNLEMLEGSEAKKIFDFCNGAIYALDGRIEKISRGIFLLAPKNVDVLGNVKEELAEKGIFSWSTVE